MELGDVGRLGDSLAPIADQEAVNSDRVGVTLPRVDSASVDARLSEPAKLVRQFCFPGQPTGEEKSLEFSIWIYHLVF